MSLRDHKLLRPPLSSLASRDERLNALPVDEQAGRRWLLTVARHVVIDDCRKRQARPVEVAPLTERVTPGDLTAATALANVALREAVAGLGPAHRDVLIGILVENRAPSEVAERLGIPLGTARSRLHYALRALRDGVSPPPPSADHACHRTGPPPAGS